MTSRFPASSLLFLLCLSTFLFACKETAKTTTDSERSKALDQLKANMDSIKKVGDIEKEPAFWRRKLIEKPYANDSVLRARLHYNLAGAYYGQNKLDSVKSNMEIAWTLMENQTGFQEIKALLYSGLGNIANEEHKINQSNYYYNQAAQMVMADTSLKMTNRQKVTLFFAAGQSSQKLRQYDNAFKMNRAAMALLPQLDNEEKLVFRAYSQMANCYYQSDRSLDSLYHYIKKMDAMQAAHPTEEKARFIYDRKAVFYDKIKKLDSALYYSQKRLSMDIDDAASNGIEAVSVRTTNMFISYSDHAGILLKAKKVDSAFRCLEHCEAFMRTYNKKPDEDILLVYRQNLVNYLFASKRYAAAEKQQKMLNIQYRTLYENENARSTAEMATIYQLQAKDKSISNLNETVTLTKYHLQRNTLWLTITALAALLAIVTAALIYYIQGQRKLLAQHERAQLEQRLLRTQMEPHFIFNTLSALQSFVRFDEKEKTLKYLNQFGRLLRSSLELSRESMAPLSEEISTLENYLSLQQMRYDNAFDYDIQVPEEQELDLIYIPPMLMQPFVENAIIHGIDPNKKDGMITVSFEISHTVLKVQIKDNGNGISDTIGNAKHKSLSTAISKERLEILSRESGQPSGILISSEPQKGTTVLITIPITNTKPGNTNMSQR